MSISSVRIDGVDGSITTFKAASIEVVNSIHARQTAGSSLN
jgi:hypothetical protein